jgi:hypothetical protein
MTDEFENALAWFSAAPAAWIESGKKSLAASAEWVWEVLQGDFNEEQSTAQVATGTVISMIPFVDQLCDVRDVVANCRQLKKEPDQFAHWIALTFTLIGLIPTLGSFLKGCLKVVVSSARKAGTLGREASRLEPLIEASVAGLNRFLARPAVVKTLKALRIDNPYKYLAAAIRDVAGELSARVLLNGFNDAAKAAESILHRVQKWGTPSLASKADDLLRTLDDVRSMAGRNVPEALKSVQDFLNGLARHLDVEGDTLHRAYLNNVNPHGFVRLSQDEEVAAFEKAMPRWVDKTGELAHKALSKPPKPRRGWPSTSSYDTFHSMEAKTIPPGTTLYRIVDPASKDNSICWMTEAEFKKLKSKDDWRRRFAVWAKWNSNGEFVTYTVPHGTGLNVWAGITASQQLKGSKHVLEGGAVQIVLDPSHLEKSHLSRRLKTDWGYDDLGSTRNLVGVPVQTNKWEKE